jgi:transcriptional regulator with PAS, ATPase and Fis domain
LTSLTNNNERQDFHGIEAIICSSAMREVLNKAKRAARSNAVVLITGETGCGKEVIARAMHSYSLRCGKPWVDVNCAALPDQLMESELFGHEKGAFSGADSMKPGLFELAHGGTIFLDEIGELDPKMQVKLLRVLDGVPYYRLGGVRKVTVDVRIVAATNRDLEEDSRTGKFRHDLFHRLDQIHIHVPPLRERREAIAPLAQFFLTEFAPTLHFKEEALEALLCYDWPGNVRQLRNAVIKAAIATESDAIGLADLSVTVRAASQTSPADLLSGGGSTSPALSLDAMERSMILQAITESNDYQRAADQLGISRRTLSRKMRSYQLEEVASVAAAN